MDSHVVVDDPSEHLLDPVNSNCCSSAVRQAEEEKEKKKEAKEKKDEKTATKKEIKETNEAEKEQKEEIRRKKESQDEDDEQVIEEVKKMKVTNGINPVNNNIDERSDPRYEMIIRESVPQELPPDVVRCGSRLNDGLDDLQIDLGSLRSRFESTNNCNTSTSNSQSTQQQSSTLSSTTDKSALQRSESILIRLKRYQSAISGGRKMSGKEDEEGIHSEEEEESSDGEINSKDDPAIDGVTKESKGREKIVPFAGLSSLKSQWESGNVVNGNLDTSNNKESINGESETDVTDGDVKEELYKLRQRICLGRSASMRQIYEKGVPALSVANGFSHRQESALVASSVKAGFIKDKFEKGQIEPLDDKMEALRQEKLQDLNVVAVAETAAREAKQIFKKMDACLTNGNLMSKNKPPSNSSSSSPRRSFVNGGGLSRSMTTSAIRPNRLVDPVDVVRYCDPVEKEDVIIDTNKLQERYKFFETYQEVAKEPKRFEMTPPRDLGPSTTMVESQPSEVNGDIIKCSYVTNDIPKTDTASKMLGKFKQLESQASQDVVLPDGPKPLKRITPPREIESSSNQSPSSQVVNNNNEGDDVQDLKKDEETRDPNIVRSGDKLEEVIPVAPEMARNLKAKFENWTSEIAMNERNRIKDSSLEPDPEIPSPEITKNLKAKFEAAIHNDANPGTVDKPKPRVNRFVRTSSMSSS